VASNSPEMDARKIDGQLVISELLRNMELGRFEMAYSTLLPCIFRVYLHPDDYNRLKGVNDLIVEDARRALSAHVSKLNTASTLLPLRRRKPAREHRIAAPDWVIQMIADTEGAIARGNIEIHSELSETEAPGLKGVRTTLIDDGEKTVASGRATRIGAPGTDRIFADIRYQDDTGAQLFLVTQNVVRVGRGAEDEPMDLALYTNDEVSREHLVLRREPATGQFFATDKSTNGTWLEGKRMKRDVEHPLPEKINISVAEVITLLFQVRK
jgi:pSer/pThr/pTyr-binding forkhead associated (FHA) protein